MQNTKLFHEIFTIILLFDSLQITWIDGFGNVINDGIEYSIIPLPDLRRHTAKSVLRLTPKKEHHNTTFICQAQNTADRSYRSAKIRMEVNKYIFKK